MGSPSAFPKLGETVSEDLVYFGVGSEPVVVVGVVVVVVVRVVEVDLSFLGGRIFSFWSRRPSLPFQV